MVTTEEIVAALLELAEQIESRAFRWESGDERKLMLLLVKHVREVAE